MVAKTMAVLINLFIIVSMLFSGLHCRTTPSDRYLNATGDHTVMFRRKSMNWQAYKEYHVHMRSKAVKNHTLSNGDVVHCIKFEDQLSLYGRNITYPDVHAPLMNTSSVGPKQLFEIEIGSCGEGEIPALGTSRHLEEFDSFENKAVDGAIHKYALYRNNMWSRPITAAETYANVWNPIVGPKSESSMSQIWLSSKIPPNPSSPLNTLEVGWHVYVEKYGDVHFTPRLFNYWTSNGYLDGCYNLECRGFVQQNKRVLLGGVGMGDPNPGGFSIFGSHQVETKFKIELDKQSGLWTLYINDQYIGFWEKDLVPQLNNGAKEFHIGGEVGYKKPDLPSGGASICMGSCKSPSEGYGQAAYHRHIQVATPDEGLHLPLASSFVGYKDLPCYDVSDFVG